MVLTAPYVPQTSHNITLSIGSTISIVLLLARIALMLTPTGTLVRADKALRNPSSDDEVAPLTQNASDAPPEHPLQKPLVTPLTPKTPLTLTMPKVTGYLSEGFITWRQSLHAGTVVGCSICVTATVWGIVMLVYWLPRPTVEAATKAVTNALGVQ